MKVHRVRVLNGRPTESFSIEQTNHIEMLLWLIDAEITYETVLFSYSRWGFKLLKGKHSYERNLMLFMLKWPIDET